MLAVDSLQKHAKTTSETFRLFGLIMTTSTNFEDSRNQREIIQVSRDSESLLASPLLVDLLAVRFIVRDAC